MENRGFGPHRRAHGNSLGRIDHAAAAYRQNQAELMLLAQFDAFPRQAQARIRLNAAQLNPGDPGLLERGCYPIIQSRSLNAAAAKMQQNLLL